MAGYPLGTGGLARSVELRHGRRATAPVRGVHGRGAEVRPLETCRHVAPLATQAPPEALVGRAGEPCLATGFSLPFAPAAPHNSPMPSLLLHDATLIYGTGADPRAGVSVLVEDGRIDRTAASPSPGLAHSHLPPPPSPPPTYSRRRCYNHIDHID